MLVYPRWNRTDRRKGVPSIFNWRPTTKGRRPKAGVVLGHGAATPPHQLGAWGALVWAPQRGSGRSRFSTVFSTQDGLSWPIILLIIIDYHAAIGVGEDPYAPPPLRTLWTDVAVYAGRGGVYYWTFSASEWPSPRMISKNGVGTLNSPHPTPYVNSYKRLPGAINSVSWW